MSEPIGIIYPDPDLRGIVDSTAKYVAKNGGIDCSFEQKIKREHQNKPKFRFLFSGDPFHAYYRHKVEEFKSSLFNNLAATTSESSNNRQRQQDDHADSFRGEPQPAASNSSESARTLQQHPMLPQDEDRLETKTDNNDANENQNHYDNSQPQHDDNNSSSGPRVRPKLDEYIQEMTMKLEEPPHLNFLAAPAPNLTNMDCDIIKLTAQFIATYGRSFLLELVSREQNNCQFDFLKPQHGQFSYMSNLIMQYALIRNQPLDILEQITKDATSQKHNIERMKMRAEWIKMLEFEQKKREEAEEKEKLLYNQIDWHDFVIVETIDYQPHEKGEYPPTTADQVGTRLLLQQRFEEQTVSEEMEIDMDVESDEDDASDDQLHQEERDKFLVPQAVTVANSDKVLIRKDYNPKLASKGQATQPDNYFVSPITNERIAVDQIHEHIKYNLADPRYLEKKDQMLQEKINEEAVFASGSQIHDSLHRLAERRTDIFGMNDKETAIGRRIGEEGKAQTKDDRLIWDGHKSSLKKKKLG